MPFPDEIRPVTVVPYQQNWAADFQTLAVDLWTLRLADRGIIEHVGSTSVPGLAAKDVIDIQLRVPALDPNPMSATLGRLGYRRRPEDWNNAEPTRAGPVAKLVFAPPVGSRPCNVHVRVHGSQGARDTLLFRDFLRSEPAMRDAWGILKTAAASLTAVEDLAGYARIKDPAWQVLMYGADRWADEESWKPEPLVAWR
ncbi:MAG: GrpB family protein [Acidimicrobiia bacterium]